MTPSLSLKKHERLKSKILLDKLFQEGQSAFSYPFKLLYRYEANVDADWPLLFSVTVPKKKVRSAVKRNLIKRRTREAYRLHKSDLQAQLASLQSHRLSLMLIYIESEAVEYAKIEKGVLKLVNKLTDAIPS